MSQGELVLDLFNTIERFANSSGIRKRSIHRPSPHCRRIHLVCEPAAVMNSLLSCRLKVARPVSLVQPLRVRRYAQALASWPRMIPSTPGSLAALAPISSPPLDPIDEQRCKLNGLLNAARPH